MAVATPCTGPSFAGAGARGATGTVILRPRDGAGMPGRAADPRWFARVGGRRPQADAGGSLAEPRLGRPSGRMRGAQGVADRQERTAPDGAAALESRGRGKGSHPRRYHPRRTPYDRAERDYGEFRRAAAQMLRELDDGCRADAARHARYGYKPCPIFRINLTQRVPYGRFKKSLESANVETISSATERSGYWVVAGGRGHAGRLDRQIERRAASRGPTFVDAIASFGEADPAKKLGASLERRPIGCGFELVDVEAWRLGDDALEAFEGQLRMMVADNGGRMTDTYRTHDTFVAQIACDAALLSTVAALREVVRVDRPLWAETDGRARRAARKIATVGAGASPHPPARPAARRPAPGARRGCGRDSAPAPAIGPPAMCRRAPPPAPTAGARSHPVSGPHPLGAGMEYRAGGRTR